MIKSVKEVLETYRSQETNRLAEVLSDGEMLWVRFYQDGVLVAAETYEGKSQRFFEDAAENYVNGIKNI